MDRTRCLLLSLLVLPLNLQAAGRADVESLCAPWREVPIPATDTGDAAPDCDATTLYYGADGTGGDAIDARHCAYRERATGADSVMGKFFGGSATLMMLYANGEGVARELPLARRFACGFGGALAEVEGRLAHLQRIEDGEAPGRFDVCDHITSGFMGGMCAAREADVQRVGRERQWQVLQSDWTPAQLDAWRVLRAAADVYFEHVGSAGIDLSGSGRVGFMVEAREILETQLLKDVQRFERGERPGQSPGDLGPLDRELNAVYRNVRAQLQAGATPHPYSLSGSITADGVRDTQRAWLRYRGAWVAFAATRWADAAPDTWRAWLTHRRTAALDAITGGP